MDSWVHGVFHIIFSTFYYKNIKLELKEDGKVSEIAQSIMYTWDFPQDLGEISIYLVEHQRKLLTMLREKHYHDHRSSYIIWISVFSYYNLLLTFYHRTQVSYMHAHSRKGGCKLSRMVEFDKPSPWF